MNERTRVHMTQQAGNSIHVQVSGTLIMWVLAFVRFTDAAIPNENNSHAFLCEAGLLCSAFRASGKYPFENFKEGPEGDHDHADGQTEAKKKQPRTR